MKMSAPRIWALSYLLLSVALISLAVYTRGVDQAWRECIPPVVKQNTEAQQAARDAANERDWADIERLNAWERVLDGVAPESEYRQASANYRKQVHDAIRTRQENPLSNYEDACHATD